MVHAAWSDWLWSAIVCGLFGYEVYMLGYSVSAIAHPYTITWACLYAGHRARLSKQLALLGGSVKSDPC